MTEHSITSRIEAVLMTADRPLGERKIASILGLIAELQEKHGTAVLFITHDMGVVAEIADRASVGLCTDIDIWV